MRKIGLIASRELQASITSKGFVLGLLIMPTIFAIAFVLGPRFMNQSGPPVRGEALLVDPTGRLADVVSQALDPKTIVARRTAASRAVLEAEAGEAANQVGNQQIDRALGQVPEIRLTTRPAGNPESDKAWLNDPGGDRRHMAVVSVHPDAVVKADGRADYGTYDLYLGVNIDERVEAVIREAMRDALIGARARSGGIDRAQLDALMRVVPPAPVTVTANAETRTTQRAFNRTLPFIFAGLLVFGVMIGGQTLLTSTVEEKSSRVVEVLLSAVSPFELMAGKLLGQLAVSLLVLALYIGLGLMALVSAATIGLLDPLLVVYLLVFFLISYVVFAAIMTAIGAAVNEMRDAQSLLGPVMLVLMLPWILAFPISRDPNTPMAIGLSFLPPVNTFVMMIRLTSSAPPPFWQVALTAVIGLLSAVAAIWFGGKVFKIGLLMHGKAPNMATLVRWARMA